MNATASLTQQEALLRGEAVGEARQLRANDEPLPLGQIFDIAAFLERVEKSGALEGSELQHVAKTGRSLSLLRKHIQRNAGACPVLSATAVGMTDLSHVVLPILEALDDDGRLLDSASPALYALRQRVMTLRQELERRMKGFLEDDALAPHLQDAYFTQREERYVLPIRTDGKGFVRGIVHGQSQSGHTVYIEPEEIVDLNNRLRLAEGEVQNEERRLLVEYSGWVAEDASAFRVGVAAATEIDVIAAAATLADELNASPVEWAPDGAVDLYFARHPLMLLAGRRPVPSDIRLAAGTALVISGPNAGGKTVALSTVGLCVLMAKQGLHIPAERGSRLGWFSDVFTDIGDLQSLERNLSTFTGHIQNMRQIGEQARPGVLILIDEIAAGTDPEQGAALALAVLESFLAAGATVMVTTHYEKLKVAASMTPQFANASVGFDLSKMAPTFKLHLGVPGSSGAFAIAARTGLAPAILARAKVLLGEAEVRIDQLLSNVAEQRRKLEEERAMVLAELEALEGDRARLRQSKERHLAMFEKQARRVHGEAVSALKGARSQVDEVRAELRRNAKTLTVETVQQAKRRIDMAAKQVAKHEPARPGLPGRIPVSGELRVGTPVVVRSMGGRGTVLELPAGGRIKVQVGVLPTWVAEHDVLIDTHQQAAAKHERKVKQAPVVMPPLETRAGARTPQRTVDVRGHRVDEALAAIDRFIDDSLLQGVDVVFVLHGHGTGVLRSAVREHVKRHPGVTKSAAAETSQGGDGVTTVWLS